MTDAKTIYDALETNARRTFDEAGDVRAVVPPPFLDQFSYRGSRVIVAAAVTAFSAYLLSLRVANIPLESIGRVTPNTAAAIFGGLPSVALCILIGGIALIALCRQLELVSGRAWAGLVVLPIIGLLIGQLPTAWWTALVDVTTLGRFNTSMPELALANFPTPLWLGFAFIGLAWWSGRVPRRSLTLLTTLSAFGLAWYIGLQRVDAWHELLVDVTYSLSTGNPVSANSVQVQGYFDQSRHWAWLRAVADGMLLLGIASVIRTQTERAAAMPQVYRANHRLLQEPVALENE